VRYTHFIKSIVGAFILVPTVVLADEQAASVFVLANHVDENNQQIALSKYAEVDAKLNEFLSAQNLNVTSSFSATHSVPNFSNEFESNIAKLSTNDLIRIAMVIDPMVRGLQRLSRCQVFLF
jgi:predicted double-glycine peptidase